MVYGLLNGHVTDDVKWLQRCCETVRSAILATAWLLVLLLACFLGRPIDFTYVLSPYFDCSWCCCILPYLCVCRCGVSLIKLLSIYKKNDLFFIRILTITARCYTERGIVTANRPSVRPSVTLRYRAHISWNTLKIISWLIILCFLLSVDRNITDLRQRNTSNVWPEYGWPYSCTFTSAFIQRIWNNNLTVIGCRKKHAASRGFPATARLSCRHFAN